MISNWQLVKEITIKNFRTEHVGHETKTIVFKVIYIGSQLLRSLGIHPYIISKLANEIIFSLFELRSCLQNFFQIIVGGNMFFKFFNALLKFNVLEA